MSAKIIDVRGDINAVLNDMSRISKDMQDVALMRAINGVANQVRTAASKEIRQAGYGIKAADIKKQIKIIRASKTNLVARIVASGKPIPLIKYSARKTARGVSVNVLNGRKIINGSFIATMQTGHTGVYARDKNAKHKKVVRAGKTTWSALPIKELYGPSVPDAFVNGKVNEALLSLIKDKFPEVFKREVKFILSR